MYLSASSSYFPDHICYTFCDITIVIIVTQTTRWYLLLLLFSMYEAQSRDIKMLWYTIREKYHQSHSAVNFDNDWAGRICPFANSDMNVLGVTNYFLIGTKACSMRWTHSQNCYWGQELVIFGPKGDCNTIVLLNEHSLKEILMTYCCAHTAGNLSFSWSRGQLIQTPHPQMVNVQMKRDYAMLNPDWMQSFSQGCKEGAKTV